MSKDGRKYRWPENLMRRLRPTPDGCVEFTGAQSKGYGMIRAAGTMKWAHRAMYELMIGPIPDGMTIDHLCRNTLCVNPGHLEVVTSAVNTMRGTGAGPTNAAKTHCNHGHEFTPENTYVWKSKRYCRACGRRRARERYHSQ